MAETGFHSLDAFRAALAALPHVDVAAQEAAVTRIGLLTKPPGALGRLEDLAIWYAAWRGAARPRVSAPHVVVFAGNLGFAARGVSAFPAEVTVQMVANFETGGAAINQLSNAFGARMDVHALSLDDPTADFTLGPAMNEAELLDALRVGWDAVDPTADLFVTGEMGIGNTTSAAALSMALFGGEAQDWVGRGTGVDDAGLARKREVVVAGLQANPDAKKDPLEALRCLGGRELAAMAGAIARARHERIPVILDGFICCAAAAVLEKTQQGALDHAVAGHVSAETAHAKLLGQLGKEPLLSLGLRLGEASGAALAIGVLKGAIACQSGMASFDEAGVASSDVE
jgi:nicotinate-nucleotide--dimethylbenzimidazole phosphoribosyltransferase